MKRELLKPGLALAAAATLFTGCASMNSGGGYSSSTEPVKSSSEPVNSLAYTVVTDAKELGKWTGDPFLNRGVRSTDLYYFQVPDTHDRPDHSFRSDQTSMDRSMDRERPSINSNLSSSHLNSADGSGVGGPGRYQSGYQSESQSYRVVRHQPGFAR
ncbi:MAG: hypothetical protein U1G07_03885 [Verrucomicrobiota bacterium]